MVSMMGSEFFLSRSASTERSMESLATSSMFPAFAWYAMPPWMGAMISQTDSLTERYAPFARSKSSPISWKSVSCSRPGLFEYPYRLSYSSKYVSEDVKNAEPIEVRSSVAVTADLASAESLATVSEAHSDFQRRSSHSQENAEVLHRTSRQRDFASSDSS